MVQSKELMAHARKDSCGLFPEMRLFLIKEPSDPGDLVGEMLKESGIPLAQLERASHLPEAIQQLKKHPVDTVILEVDYFNKAGLETLRALRAAAPTAAILILTGKDDEQAGLMALMEGAEDYVIKGGVDSRVIARTLRYAIERHRSKQKVHEAEEFLRASINALSGHIAIVDETGSILFVNNSWRRFGAANGGVSGEQSERTNYLAVCEGVEGEDTGMALCFAQGIRDVLSGKRACFEMEYPCNSPDEERWFIGRVSKFSGKGPCLVAINHEDITGRKRTERQLQASETRYRRLFESAKDGILILDADTGQIVDVNPFLLDLLGFSYEYFLSKKLWEIGLFRDISASEESFAELQKTEYVRYEDLPLKTHDGRAINVEFVSNVYLVDSVRVIQCNIRDITERKRAEHKLLTSETCYRRLFESAKDGILILDANTGQIVDVNPFLLDLLGFPHAYFLRKKIWEIGLFKDIAASEDAFVKLQEKGYVRYEHLPLKTKDGESVEVEFVSNVYWVDSTKVVQCNIRDITERKQANDALALHGKRVQVLLDLQLLAYEHENVVLDFVLEACLGITQSEYAFVGTMDDTESVMRIYRWSNEAKAGCELSNQPIDYPICAAGLWGDCVRKRVPVICNDYPSAYSDTNALPDGHVAIQRFVAVPVLDGNRIVAVAAVANKARDYRDDDVSALSTLLQKMWEILSRHLREREREALEEQYRQAQKMEAVGQLAGGVAHDFNNILHAILGFSSMLTDRLPKDGDAYGFAKEITQGAERAAALTQQLLAFSRSQILEMKDVELNDIVYGLTKMIRRIIGENIEVVVVEGRRLGIIHADRGQMEQVLLNLCVNARDAMPEGGVLTIGTESVIMDSEYSAMHAWASPGRYVLLTVSDTGCGMDTATQARIFEPFFTTKELGKGTGLGLATVYGIVRQHQGMVQVYSEVGLGTTFKVYLPSFEREVTAPVVKTVLRARGGTETILVAEDDETVRKLATRILEQAGYTVLLAIDGKEALSVFEQHASEIHLCLLDVVMPRLGGKAVYDALRQQYSDLRFLFSSGYSADAIHTGFILQEDIELIQKPYSADALLRKIRQVLDEPNTPASH